MEGEREIKFQGKLNNMKELGKNLNPHISLLIYDFYTEQNLEYKELIQKEKLNLLLNTLMHEKTKELLDNLKISDKKINDLYNEQVKICQVTFESLKNKLNIIETEDIKIFLDKYNKAASKDYESFIQYSKWLFEKGKYEGNE